MKKLLIVFTCIHLSLLSFAQELPNKCSAFTPRSLLESKVLKENEVNQFLKSGRYEQDIKPSQKKYWTVYSDRSDNKTYTTPGGSQVKTILKFNEPLRIAQIQGNYALVYFEPNKAKTYPQISDDAVCKGWISMDHLLLWDTCLANERGIYYKALLCINTDEITDNTTFGLAYTNPEDLSTQISLTTDMKFYFVMKRAKDGTVLLATQHTMNGTFSDKVLYAWVPKESYVPWNQRSCIEPNWEHESVEHFSKRGMKVKIYDNKNLTGETACSIPFRWSDSDYDEFQYRMKPAALRFPILDGSNDEMYECSSFTSSDGSSIMDEFDMAKVRELKKLKHINLVIVIDGTKSMEKYFPAVRQAILSGCEYYDKEKYDIKVGIMIYRDYSDSSGMYEICNFKDPMHPDLHRFLQTGGEYGIRSGAGDRTYTEALFAGINAALDKFNLNPEESNLMLVVGDCGNPLNDSQAPGQDVITKKIIEKNVNVFSYQVRNINMEAWNLFNNQMLMIIKNSMSAKYKALSQASLVRARITREGQVFYNSTSDNNELYQGAHKYATVGNEISPQVLLDLMTETIKNYSLTVDDLLDNIFTATISDLAPIKAKTNFVSGNTKQVKEALTIEINKKWLQKRLGDVYERSSGDLVSFRGWTLKKDPSDYNFFKPVIFISTLEFDELMTRLKPVKDVARISNSDNREPYINAIKALLKSMAPGMTDKEMEQKGIDEVMNMINGLNAHTESMSNTNGPTLLEISDQTAVSPAEYRTIVSNFERKYDILDQLKSSNEYKYFREFNGAKYYWIPIDFLP